MPPQVQVGIIKKSFFSSARAAVRQQKIETEINKPDIFFILPPRSIHNPESDFENCSELHELISA